jgi:hypothetical protein
MSKRGAGTVEYVEKVPRGLEDGPGASDGDGVWESIRVAFTRWKVSAPVTPGDAYLQGEPCDGGSSWERFAGYVHHESGKWKFDTTPSFLGECEVLGNLQGWPAPHRGRNLHREEMNLCPAGEYLEMYDRLVGKTWQENPERMEFLNKDDPLPLVHIIVNKSDGPLNHFDLFFPHELHYGNNDTVCYTNKMVFSGQHQQKRKISAEAVGACSHCATTLDQQDWTEYRDTGGTVSHIRSGYSSTFPIDEIYGYREFGPGITENMTAGKMYVGIIVHLPKGNQVDRIFLPRNVVHDVLFNRGYYGKRWTKMRIFPYEDLP